jgi:hypothetical protein
MVTDLRMTAGDPPTNGDRRAAARDAYRASLTAGEPLSGAALGRQFDMSDRWGRDRVTEVQRQDTARTREAGSAIRDASAETEDVGPVTRDGVTVRSVPTVIDEREADPATGSWLDSTIILIVAAVAAAASYGHMLEVAQWAGEPLWIARAFPVTVDGLVLAALRRGRQGRWWLALGIAVSVAANMLARYPDLAATAGPIVSAWPPLALFGTHRLLHVKSQR